MVLKRPDEFKKRGRNVRGPDDIESKILDLDNSNFASVFGKLADQSMSNNAAYAQLFKSTAESMGSWIKLLAEREKTTQIIAEEGTKRSEIDRQAKKDQMDHVSQMHQNRTQRKHSEMQHKERMHQLENNHKLQSELNSVRQQALDGLLKCIAKGDLDPMLVLGLINDRKA